MKNFKQQLDQELGPKRFDAAMQARITKHITETKPAPRKDLRYVFSMIGATALLALLILMTLNISYEAPLANASFDDPLKDFYMNSGGETEKFKATTSIFDFETEHIRGQADTKRIEQLMDDAQPSSTDRNLQDYEHIDLIVRYENGDTRPIQLYDDLEGRYWLYDVSTKQVYEGMYKEDKYEYGLIWELQETSQKEILFTFLTFIALAYIVHFVSKKIMFRLGIPYIKKRYLFKKQRYISITLSVIVLIVLVITDTMNPLYFFCAVLIDLFTSSYYEYRYAREDRQYIADTITTIFMIIAFFIVLYVKSYF